MKLISLINFSVLSFLLSHALPATAADQHVNKKATVQKAQSASEGSAVTPMDEPLIMVNGDPVTSRLYMNFLQAHPNIMAQAAGTEAGKKEALRELVTAVLLQNAMLDEGLLKKGGENPSQKQMIEAYEALAAKHFPLPPNPDDVQGYAYYQSHQNEFGIPPMIRLNEIFFKLNSGSDKAVEASVNDRAKKALERIKKNESFVKVADELTENPIGKLTHGDIGFVEIGDEKWMQDAVQPLKAGEYTDIIKSPKGLVILQVADIRPGLVSPYANVRDKVIKTLRDNKQKEARDPYVRELAKKSKIEVVSPHIKPLFPNGVFID